MIEPALQATPVFPEILVPRLWAALCERLHDPVRESSRKGMRVVEVLGVLRYHLLPTARRVHFAYAVGDGRFVSGHMREFVSLDPVLAGDLWLAYFAANWLLNSPLSHGLDLETAPLSHGLDLASTPLSHGLDLESTPLSLGRGAGGEGINFPALVQSLRKTPAFRLLLDRVRACLIEGPLRDRVTEALALDPQNIRRTWLGLPRGELATINSRQYSAAWRRQEGFAQLERECPTLLRPYAAAVQANALGLDPEPMRDLKLALCQYGIGDAGWRVLLGASPAYFDSIIANSRNEDLFEVYLWALRVCVGAGGLLPDRVLHRLVMPNGREPGRRALLNPDILEGYWPHFLRALGRRLASVNGARELCMFLDSEFEDVYDWLEWVDPAIDANQARAGWAWMVKQHRAWQERERERALSRRAQMRWEVPVPTFEHGPWRVVALRDSYELWEEGHHMRHCSRTYAESCKRSKYIVFSIRDLSGERVATGSLDCRSGSWEVRSVRALANRPASPRMLEVARAYAGACEASTACAEPASPLPRVGGRG